jgi:KDO2-lipid IV(A) lauroyltransferase
MRDALARGGGLMAITGHIGNWELLAAYCSMVGFPVNAIGRRLHSPLLNRLLIAVRARAGVRTILRESPASSRAILRTLKRNEILALLIDQDTRGPRVFVPFFGRLAATPSGVAALARRTNVPVLPLFISRRPDGGHRIVVHPPFADVDRDRDSVESLTAAYTAAIERHVREHPTEWVWWHRRWRHQPAASEEGGQSS